MYYYNDYFKIYSFFKNNILKEFLIKNWSFEHRSSMSEIKEYDGKFYVEQEFEFNKAKYTFSIEYGIHDWIQSYIITCKSQEVNFSLEYAFDEKNQTFELKDKTIDITDETKYWKFAKSIHQIFLLKNNERNFDE